MQILAEPLFFRHRAGWWLFYLERIWDGYEFFHMNSIEQSKQFRTRNDFRKFPLHIFN